MLRVFLALFLFVLAPFASAQEQVLTSPVLTIDQEELFQRSKFGQEIRNALEVESRSLANENREIEAELVAEEKKLTEDRQVLTPEEFRAKAKAFDEKVVEIRASQDEKTRRLLAEREALEQRFLQAVLPVLAQIIRERGATVVLDERSVFLAVEQVDITEEAITRIDAQYVGQSDEAAPAE